MALDPERRAMVDAALEEAGADGLVCALPAHVLLVSGYWPVVGTSIAVVVREGPVALLVPRDEEALAQQGGADEIRTFQPATLERIQTAVEGAREPLARLAGDLKLRGRRIAQVMGSRSEGASYSEMHLYRGDLTGLIETAFEPAGRIGADSVLETLQARKTAREISRLRLACLVAGEAFEQGKRGLRSGLIETEAASLFQAPLAIRGIGREGVERAGGFTYCMSGPNAALAAGAYARSRARRLADQDLVLVHCNSYVDGYWTDITRTYCLGQPKGWQREVYEAVFEARSAALAAIKPGARAADVDRAARSVLSERGLGKEFKHPTGHGVGFSAISSENLPRLHPQSPDVLEPGMVFNVEPAVYLEGKGGLRHCDMVAVTAQGVEVLTSFQGSPADLLIASAGG